MIRFDLILLFSIDILWSSDALLFDLTIQKRNENGEELYIVMKREIERRRERWQFSFLFDLIFD